MNIKAQEFWHRVSELANKQGLLQSQIADKLGVSLNTYKGWIQHVRLPDIDLGLKLADILCTSVDYLVNGNGKETRLDPDTIKIINMLESLTPEQRKPIVILVEGQVNYWRNNS